VVEGVSGMHVLNSLGPLQSITRFLLGVLKSYFTVGQMNTTCLGLDA